MSTKKLLKIPVRKDWYTLSSGRQALSLGVRGCSVHVMQRENRDEYVAVTRLRGRRVQACLRTKSQAEARRRAEEFLVKIHEHDKAPAQPLTLCRLWDLYREESAGYRQNTERTKKDKASSARRLFAAFGEGKRVDYLSPNDADRYLAMRKSRVGWRSGRTKAPVGARASADDLCLLRAMLRWALNERLPDGSWLLEHNPLRGVKLPREESPLRPVASHERYENMREAAQQFAATAKKEAGRTRWLRFDLALAIAEATGARIGSIRGLKWSNIDYKYLTICWVPEFHKRRRETVVPITPELASELRTFQTRLGAVGDTWLFPRKMIDQPWPREVFRQLWVRAEEQAGIPHVKGGGWHMLRRKWAIERKALSPVDVAGAGGWKDLAVLQTIYQIPTRDGMLRVMAHPEKLREQQVVARE